jgi:organic radical activating enzyme
MTKESDLPHSKMNFTQDWQFNKWWNKELDLLRDKMLRGKVDKGCRYCIKKEQDGFHSLRQSTNAYIKDTFEQIKKDYSENKRQYPEQVELRLGNYCNLKCIMCGPYASSSINAEYKMHQKKYNDFGIVSNWQDPNMPKDWSSYTHNKKVMLDVVHKARRIHFGGGEPFISPAIVEVLDSISPTTYLRFNTNMTKINDRVLDALGRFKKIEIEASIDGVGAKHEYIRNGSDWNVIKKNFRKLQKNPNINLEINYVLQHTSLYTLKDVVKFAQENNIKINFGEVYYGSVDGSGHLTINSAPPALVQSFQKWLDSTDFRHKSLVQSWVSSYRYSETLNQRFKKYVEMLDGIRNTKFIDTFPPLT